MALVRKRRSIEETIGRIFSKKSPQFLFSADKEADFLSHLGDIFPLALFSNTTPVDLQNIDRHMQCLIMRLERFHANPGKDNQKADQLEPYLKKLHQLLEKKGELSEDALEQLTRFEELVNEYRISLFAPEIKTREPISPKKLDKQWGLTLAKC